MTVQAPERWQAHAEEAAEPDERMLSLGQLAAETGLSPQTVLTAVHSSAHSGSTRSRLRALARPAFNVGGVPYWSREQAADYHRQVAARWSAREEFAHLPVIESAEQAQQRGLLWLRGLSRASGVPLTTLHRWKLMEGFPAPVAVMEVGSPTFRLLYDWTTVRAWMLTRPKLMTRRSAPPETPSPEAWHDDGEDD